MLYLNRFANPLEHSTMKALPTFPVMASIVSWASIALFLLAALTRSPALLAVTGALCILTLGLEIRLLRRKLSGRLRSP